MRKTNRFVYLASRILILGSILILSGCFARSTRRSTNYYVLDYLSATERANLRQSAVKPVSMEVWDTNVARAYSRNQMVIKENNFRIRYMPYDVWATRLSDAIPNLIVQRMRAYNIFQKVDRDVGAQNPNYYLETNLLNLEKVSGKIPKAYLRMEFYLRDSATQRILLTHKAESYKLLTDPSMVYLVQTYNEMIMEETDIFAARTIMMLNGREIFEARQRTSDNPVEQFYLERINAPKASYDFGELYLHLTSSEHSEMYYFVSELDSTGYVVDRFSGIYNQPMSLEPGEYLVTVGENQDIDIPVVIRPRMRTVVDNGRWSELQIMILDSSQNRVRLGYDLYTKEESELGYELYSQGYSLSEDEVGESERLWVLPPGHYMIKLGGGSWTDLRDFTTLNLEAGKSQVLTIVVDPSGERNYMLGAGVLGDESIISRGTRIHRGAVHTNISLSKKNSTAQEEPVNSFNLAAQFDNTLKLEERYFDYSLKSLYDLGMNLSTGSDFRISQDDLSLKNTLLYTPIIQNRFFRNFGLYGRGDLNTHFFDEHLYFSSPRNIIMIDSKGDTLKIDEDQTSIRSHIALFPLRIKEGVGITYRFVFSPNVSVGIRGGYGWQQEYNKRSFTFDRVCTTYCDTLDYDIYREAPDSFAKGIESTIIFSALNLFRFLSINSTLDVLFPMGGEDNSTKFESENRFNIRLFRNISIDIKANLLYDKSTKDYLLYDYSSFLRLSLFY